MQPNENDQALLRERLEEATRSALNLAGVLTAALGACIVIGCLRCQLVLSGAPFRIAAAVALFGFSLGLLVYLAAQGRRPGLASGLVAWSSALPTVYFLAAQAAGPLGGSSGILGPVTMLYPVFVACSSFLLQLRLPLLTGAFAAARLMAVYFWLAGDLERLPLPSELQFEVSSGLPWLFRATFLFAVGVVGWGTSLQARRLLSEMLAEQRQTITVSRLFGQFVSQEVRDKVLKERGELQGERMLVAVLFSDIRGCTAWSETTPPTEVVARLNQYFGAMVEVIEREGGVIDKFMGDAVMATFGGLVPSAQPALAAVQSVEGMLRRLEELNDRWIRRGKVPFHVGIGIAYGPVIQGPIGNERRWEFTVIGDPVNTASRLESFTKECGFPVVVSEAVVKQLSRDHPFTMVELGETAIRGRGEALRIWGIRPGG